MDVFTRQINSTVKGVLEESHILATNVTANMTLFYQPLDLTMNGGAKRFIAKKFNSWYSQQICDKNRYQIVSFALKSMHPACAVDFYNYITARGKEIVINGWKSAGIYYTLNHGSKKLPNKDLFHDIDPLMGDNPTTVETNLDAVCQLDQQQFDSFRSQRQQ